MSLAMPDRSGTGVEDRWWSVDALTNLDSLTAEVLNDLEQALPLIDERLDDAGFLAAATTTPGVEVVQFFRPHELTNMLAPEPRDR